MIVLLNTNPQVEGYLERFLNLEKASNENVVLKKYPDAKLILAVEQDPSSIAMLVDAGYAVLALVAHPRFDEACEILGAGARGYANVYMQQMHYQDAISSITNGGMWVLPEVMVGLIARVSNGANMRDKIQTLPNLPQREERVAQLVCEGYTNETIAQMIGVSLRTIKLICAGLYKKAGVKTRLEFVLKIGGKELADKLANRKRVRKK